MASRERCALCNTNQERHCVRRSFEGALVVTGATRGCVRLFVRIPLEISDVFMHGMAKECEPGKIF